MSWSLPRLVGTTRAADLLLSGRIFTGTETADWGLWNGVVDDPVTVATMRADNLAATTGPTAVATTKRQLAADASRTPQASVEGSLELMNEAMGSAEYAEGIAAFTERRAPRF